MNNSTDNVAPERVPQMQSMIMQRPNSIGESSREDVAAAAAAASASTETTVKSRSSIPSSGSSRSVKSNWVIQDDSLREIPSFYPLEKSHRCVNNAKPSEIASRISDCCRLMSVHARFDNDLGTASLITGEHIEIHVSLWKNPTDANTENGTSSLSSTIVEMQRRKGCAVTYHKYCRHLLDAAQGSFSAHKFDDEGNLLPVKPVAADRDMKKGDANESSLLALEIAASLLKKDRMDARQLGMESLCLLTDPAKTGMETALMASRVVLFGSVQDENVDDEFVPDELGLREAILSLVQFGRLAEYIDFDSDDEEGAIHPEEKEFNDLLHNLALAVLANALEVLELHGNMMATGASGAAAGGGASSDAEPSANAFLQESEEISNRALIATLLNVLGKAESKPHDACLSAQCLRSLFQASKDAKRKGKDLNAKQIVSTALDVGRRTHVKLEIETENVMRELQKRDDDQQQQLQHDENNDDDDEEEEYHE